MDPPTLGISVTLRLGYGYFLELHNMETHQTLNALALFAIIYSINKVQQFILFAPERPSMILISVPNLLGRPQPAGDVDLKILGTKILSHEFQSKILNLAVLN